MGPAGGSFDGLIKPIPWETRNLGLDSYELSDDFGARPDASDLDAMLELLGGRHERFFIQTRLSPEHGQAITLLCSRGFVCMEPTLVPVCSLKDNPMLIRFRADPGLFIPSWCEGVDPVFMEADKRDAAIMAKLKTMVRSMYSADRFHRDPHCLPEIADERFAHWLDDLAADEQVRIHVLRRADDLLGLAAVRDDGNMILIGTSRIAAKEGRKGLGDFLLCSLMADLADRGLVRMQTCISAANIPTLNLHARNGFSFTDPRVTLHYWS